MKFHTPPPEPLTSLEVTVYVVLLLGIWALVGFFVSEYVDQWFADRPRDPMDSDLVWLQLGIVVLCLGPIGITVAVGGWFFEEKVNPWCRTRLVPWFWLCVYMLGLPIK
jgi:hypothetical protein